MDSPISGPPRQIRLIPELLCSLSVTLILSRVDCLQEIRGQDRQSHKYDSTADPRRN
jgi:hypothetical protein